MSIKDFVVAVNDSIKLNESVVKSLSDILLSEKASTTIENTPDVSSEYFNQKGVSYLYGREPNAADMFDGEDGSEANKTPFPLIENFELGETPDIIGNHLSKKIKTLSSINDTTRLVLGTLTGVLKEYDEVVSRNKLKQQSKVWKTFKLGTYWPVSSGLSDNADFNSTIKNLTGLTYNESSKYAFIKLSPDRDAKFHFISIDVDAVEEYGVPVIFILLDSTVALDGDDFEFRIQYKNSNGHVTQEMWPEVIFFDASYNSNGVPLPSISSSVEVNQEQINNAIRIDGVDFYYVYAQVLPLATRQKYNLLVTDRVFVSAEDLNNNVVNHSGDYRVISFNELKMSKYVGYGILDNTVMKVYSNRELRITAELADGFDSEVAQQKLLRKNTISSNSKQIVFGSIVGSSIFYGRPSSFFTPKSASSYSFVEDYCDPIEGIDGNVTSQYKLKSFSSYVGNSDKNGFSIEYEINQSSLNGNIVAVRLGHFETILGLTIVYDGANLKISHYGASSDTVVTIPVSVNVRCMVGFIFTNGSLYANYVVKNDNALLFESGLVKVSSGNYVDTLLAGKIFGTISSTIENYLSEDSIYSEWNPVFSVFVDGRSATSESTTIIKNVLINHGLTKEQFYDKAIQFRRISDLTQSPIDYWNYASVRGVFDPIILRPSQIKGYLAKVDARSVNQYESSKDQNSLVNSFRIGFTYNAYKGAVLVDKYVEYSSKVTTKKSMKVDVEGYTYSPIDNKSLSLANETLLLEYQINEDSISEIKKTPSAVGIEYAPSISNISKTPQVDNIEGRFGWKVSTYYQSAGY